MSSSQPGGRVPSAIPRRICAEAARYGIGKKDILIDALCMTVSSEPEGALVTLETVEGEGVWNHASDEADQTSLARFRIRGMRDPDVEFDLESLQSRYRISEVTDESEPQYDFSALFAQHPGDMIGFYIRALQKDDMSEVEKKALYYGIHALLQTTDERSPS